MEHIDWQLRRFREGGDRPAIIWRDRACTYAELTDRYEQWLSHLAAGIRAGDSVGVLADFSPGAVSCLLALLKMRCILVPLSRDSQDQHQEFFKIADERGRTMTTYALTEDHRRLFASLKSHPLSYRELAGKLKELKGQGMPVQIIGRLIEGDFLRGFDQNGDPVKIRAALRFGGVGAEDDIS